LVDAGKVERVGDRRCIPSLFVGVVLEHSDGVVNQGATA
jgi:hypothetical protein